MALETQGYRQSATHKRAEQEKVVQGMLFATIFAFCEPQTGPTAVKRTAAAATCQTRRIRRAAAVCFQKA